MPVFALKPLGDPDLSLFQSLFLYRLKKKYMIICNKMCEVPGVCVPARNVPTGGGTSRSQAGFGVGRGPGAVPTRVWPPHAAGGGDSPASLLQKTAPVAKTPRMASGPWETEARPSPPGDAALCFSPRVGVELGFWDPAFHTPPARRNRSSLGLPAVGTETAPPGAGKPPPGPQPGDPPAPRNGTQPVLRVPTARGGRSDRPHPPAFGGVIPHPPNRGHLHP